MNTSPIRPFDFDVSGRAPLPRARGLFVTGTDTGVGKTLIAGAIARYLARAGGKVEVFKPVATGCRQGPGGLVSGDAEFLAACARSNRPHAEIAPVRYAVAVAPNVAAAQLGQSVDLEAIFRAYGRLAAEADAVIVEGVGGLLCPIGDGFWVAHLAACMKLPLVIVARAGLGTINHALLTLHAARSAQLRVAGVVVNQYGCDPDLAMRTNPAQIARRGNVEVLATVPDEPANSVEKKTIGPRTEFAISQVAWETLLGQRSP